MINKYYVTLILTSVINTCLTVYSLYLSTNQFGVLKVDERYSIDSI